MDNFWKCEWERFPDASGVDFVPLGTWPWSENIEIIQSNLKEDFENPHLCYPRSGRLYWKIVDGKKYYLLETYMESLYVKDYCNKCRNFCYSTKEIEDCCNGKKCFILKPENKRADVSFQYNLIIDSETVGISEDCSEREFAAAVEEYLNQLFGKIQDAINLIPDEVEIDIKP